MSGRGGTGQVRRTAALAICIVFAGGLASCVYEDDGEAPRTVALGQSHRPSAPIPSKGADILELETGNYAELAKRLATAAGPVLLDDSGAVDGPGIGFSKSAMVKTAGAYTVTAACVGVPDAQMSLAQDPRTGSAPLELNLDCSGILSRVIQLQAGYVSAHLLRYDPTGQWTGAVAGVKITAG